MAHMPVAFRYVGNWCFDAGTGVKTVAVLERGYLSL